MAHVHLGHLGRRALHFSRSQLPSATLVLAHFSVHDLPVYAGLPALRNLAPNWSFTHVRVQKRKGRLYAIMFVSNVVLCEFRKLTSVKITPLARLRAGISFFACTCYLEMRIDLYSLTST